MSKCESCGWFNWYIFCHCNNDTCCDDMYVLLRFIYNAITASIHLNDSIWWIQTFKCIDAVMTLYIKRNTTYKSSQQCHCYSDKKYINYKQTTKLTFAHCSCHSEQIQQILTLKQPYLLSKWSLWMLKQKFSCLAW